MKILCRVNQFKSEIYRHFNCDKFTFNSIFINDNKEALKLFITMKLFFTLKLLIDQFLSQFTALIFFFSNSKVKYIFYAV